MTLLRNDTADRRGGERQMDGGRASKARREGRGGRGGRKMDAGRRRLKMQAGEGRGGRG